MTPSLLLALALAGPPQFNDLDVQAVSDPAGTATWPKDDGWVGFSFEMNGPRSGPCCWRQEHGNDGRYGCDLNGRDHGFVTTMGSEESTRAHFLARIENGRVVKAMTVGDQCPVRGQKQTIRWLSEANAFERLDGLTQQATKPVSEQALHALAIHADPRATERLVATAMGPRQDHKSEVAVFWLGEARGAEGLQALDRLRAELPPGSTRRAITHALHINGSPAADRRLEAIAREVGSQEERGEAVFWLAQSRNTETRDRTVALIESLLEASDRDVPDQAMLALSEMKTDAAHVLLEKTARTHPVSKVRQKALFWLAQAMPERALELIAVQLRAASPGGSAQQAAFSALHHLPDEMATGLLLELARTPGPSETRRQAIFWLAESDDPAAEAAITGLGSE